MAQGSDRRHVYTVSQFLHRRFRACPTRTAAGNESVGVSYDRFAACIIARLWAVNRCIVQHPSGTSCHLPSEGETPRGEMRSDILQWAGALHEAMVVAVKSAHDARI